MLLCGGVLFEVGNETLKVRHAIFNPAKQLVAVGAQHAATLAGDVIVVKVQTSNAPGHWLLVLVAYRASAMLTMQDSQVFFVRDPNGSVAVSPLRLSLARPAPMSCQ
jgi:hypothetical protein